MGKGWDNSKFLSISSLSVLAVIGLFFASVSMNDDLALEPVVFSDKFTFTSDNLKFYESWCDDYNGIWLKSMECGFEDHQDYKSAKDGLNKIKNPIITNHTAYVICKILEMSCDEPVSFEAKHDLNTGITFYDGISKNGQRYYFDLNDSQIKYRLFDNPDGWTTWNGKTVEQFDIDNNQKLIALLEDGRVSEFNELKETLELNRIYVYLEGADLQDLDLRELNSERVNLSGANMQGVNLGNVAFDFQGFRNTNLQDADLHNADMSGAYFYNTTMQNANLQGVNMKGTHIGLSNLKYTNLQGADLSGVNFKGADLFETNFQGANLSGAILSETSLENFDFEGANMQYANLKHANLSGANLSGVDLLGANLVGTNLKNTNLSGANLQGANLNGANLLNTNLLNVQNLPISEDDAKKQGAIVN